MTDGGVIYEFVVAGTLGPVLRSILGDLDIDEKSAETRLRLTNAPEDELLSVLSVMLTDGCELDRVFVDEG